MEIKGQLMEVGTQWDGDSSLEIEIVDPKGEKRIIGVPVTKEECKRFAPHIYEPVSITIAVIAENGVVVI